MKELKAVSTWFLIVIASGALAAAVNSLPAGVCLGCVLTLWVIRK